MASSYSKYPKKKVDTSMFGHVYLHTDQTEMYGGETITGNIHLNILQDFPGNKIHLELKGKETAHLVIHNRIERPDQNFKPPTGRFRTTNMTRTDSFDFLFSTDKAFLNENVIVYEFPQEISPGQYTIPFAFCFPSNLPGSFCQDGHRHLARVRYTLKAYIPSNLEKDTSMSSKQTIIVRELFNQETTESSEKLKKKNPDNFPVVVAILGLLL